MGGPNLEIFKFTLYLCVPLAALIHFGDPEWYRTTVVPVYIFLRVVTLGVRVHIFLSLQYRDKLFPALDRTNQVFHFRFKGFNIFLIICPADTQRPKWCARRTRKDQGRKTLKTSTTGSRRRKGFKIVICICKSCRHPLTNVITLLIDRHLFNHVKT